MNKKHILIAAGVALACVAGAAWAQYLNNGFSLLPRTASSFAVPAFRPVMPNSPIALDLFPSGPNPVEQGDNGFAWFDACNADLQYVGSGVPATCARLGVRTGYIEIGSRAFDGAPDVDTCIVRGRVKIACFRSWGLEVFGVVRATQFTTQ